MIETVSHIVIARRGTPDAELPQKTGDVLAAELRGRLLILYMLPDQTRLYFHGSTAPHFVTPTPYAAAETIKYLALPQSSEPRTHFMVLDPAKLVEARGPRWVQFGLGIEYLLPNGFSEEAIMLPWALEVA